MNLRKMKLIMALMSHHKKLGMQEGVKIHLVYKMHTKKRENIVKMSLCIGDYKNILIYLEEKIFS
jgi:hypothetical protein